jgi:hypothetical protein
VITVVLTQGSPYDTGKLRKRHKRLLILESGLLARDTGPMALSWYGHNQDLANHPQAQNSELQSDNFYKEERILTIPQELESIVSL